MRISFNAVIGPNDRLIDRLLPDPFFVADIDGNYFSNHELRYHRKTGSNKLMPREMLMISCRPTHEVPPMRPYLSRLLSVEEGHACPLFSLPKNFLTTWPPS